MALKYLSNIDLGGLEIQNAKPFVITTADQNNLADATHASYLGTGVANQGKMYYNQATATFLIWKGTGFIVLDGSGDISSVALTADDNNSLTDNAGAVNFTISGDTGITTKVASSKIEIDLDDTAVTTGTYGSSTSIPNFTVDQQGRITDAGSNSITVGDATITIAGGDDLEINTDSSANGAFTTNQGTNETITLDHSTVSRSNTAQTGDLEFGDNVAIVNSITSSTTGHVTAVTTKTWTLPALGTTSADALAGNTDVLNVSNTHLLTKLAALESTNGMGVGEDIVIGASSNDTLSITGSLKMNKDSSFLSDQFTFEDGTSGKPLVVLKNTNPDAAGSTLRFTKDVGADQMADDDEIGQVEFKHDDSNNNQHLYASMQGFAKDVTNSDEIGKLKIGVSTGHGTNSYQDGIVIEGHTTDNRVDVTIGNGTDSVTTIAGDLTVTGTTTTVNSTVVDIADKNIKIAKGATTSASTDGAGITFSSWSAAPILSWNNTSAYINLNKNFNVQGDITLSGTVDGIDIATDVAANTNKETNVTTNLGHNTSATTLEVTSSDGNNTTLPVATTSAGGVMSAAQVTQLNTATTPTEVDTQIDAETKILTITGDASQTSFDLTHSFGTRYVQVEILDYGNNGSGATYATVHADVIREDDAYVTVDFAVAPSATQDYKVLLHKITA